MGSAIDSGSSCGEAGKPPPPMRSCSVGDQGSNDDDEEEEEEDGGTTEGGLTDDDLDENDETVNSGRAPGQSNMGELLSSRLGLKVTR